jgi:hypothetical protein
VKAAARVASDQRDKVSDSIIKQHSDIVARLGDVA